MQDQRSYIDSHPLNGAFIANKLRRVVDLIALQGTDLLQDAGVVIPSQSLSCVLFIGDEGPASAADVADALRHPHQVVTQRVETLIKLKLLKRMNDPADGRRKLLVLTAAGRTQHERMKARLREIETAFTGLFEEISCDPADMATKMLNALHAKPMLERINENNSSKTQPATAKDSV